MPSCIVGNVGGNYKVRSGINYLWSFCIEFIIVFFKLSMSPTVDCFCAQITHDAVHLRHFI